MLSKIPIYCFKDKQKIEGDEWVKHADHHSELAILPARMTGLKFIEVLLHSPTKNTFHVAPKFGHGVHYAISSYFMSRGNAMKISPLCIILNQKTSDYLAQFTYCEFIPYSKDYKNPETELGNLITITEFFDTKLLPNLSKFGNPKDLLVIFKNVCEAVQVLHSKNYIHSNICIKNICLDEKTKKPKLVAITNCQRIEEINYDVIYEYTNKNIWPPEFLQGYKLNEKFDVWCLGILLHQIFCDGNLPFKEYKSHKHFHKDLRESWKNEKYDFLKINDMRIKNENIREAIRSKFIIYLFIIFFI